MPAVQALGLCLVILGSTICGGIIAHEGFDAFMSFSADYILGLVLLGGVAAILGSVPHDR